MIIPLFLNSTDAVQTSKSHDFTRSFTQELVLDKNKEYYRALDSLSMSYSWYNSNSIYGNNTLKYGHDGGTTWTMITFLAGNYSYININNGIQQLLSQNSHLLSGISEAFIPSRFLVYTTLEANYQVDLTTGDCLI